MRTGTDNKTNSQNSIEASLRSIAIVLIVLGLIFRFSDLDQKVYWADESFTSLRIAGYQIQEIAQAVYNQPAITVEAFQQYQQLNPDKNIADTIKGLIAEEPQLTPLYFAAARIWSQVFGTSVAAIRSFSALLGSFAVIGMYWLCLELFESRLAGWIGAALLAVSPFQVLYSQEARPYSLMTLSIVLSSYFFLRSLQKPTRRSWGIYCLTLTLGLYSHLLTILTTLSHGLYLLVLNRFYKKRALLHYGLSLAIALLAFTPWIAALLANRRQAQAMTSWTSESISALALIRIWLGNISRLVVDFGFSSSIASQNTGFSAVFLISSVLFLFFLSAYSLYYLYQRAHPKIGLLSFALIGVAFLIVCLPDLLLGSRQSTAPRYSISLFLGIQLAITYLFTSKINKIKDELRNSDPPRFTVLPQLEDQLQKRLDHQVDNQTQLEHSADAATQFSRTVRLSRSSKFWSLLIVAIFSLSVGSCIASRTSQVWWHQAPQYTRHIPKTAALINRLKNPLVVVIPQVDSDLMRVESLARFLKPDVKLRFFRQDDDVFDISDSSDENTILFYFPFIDSQDAIENFQKKLNEEEDRSLEPIANTDNLLFRLE